MSSEGGVLLVDDDLAYLRAMERFLDGAGVSPVMVHGSGNGAIERIEAMRPEILCLDLDLGEGLDGRDLISQVRVRCPGTSVVVVTGMRDVDVAMACMRDGASDYLSKPFRPESLLDAVRRIREAGASSRAVPRSEVHGRTELVNEAFAAIATRSESMFEAFRYAESVVASTLPILVTGETGTGKELMARALHDMRIPDGPFIAVNTAGFDDAMLSDALFGHVAGAFTGGEKPRSGLVETAGEGTLFLDEIGDLSGASQVKLLRLLQENEYYPVGSDKPRRSRCRFVLATHRDLSKEPSFRQDLYWRLASHQVHLPPLRERREDIELLVRRFVADAARDLRREVPNVREGFLRELACMDFPGNIRELRGLVYDRVARCRDGFLDAVASHGEAASPVAPTFPTLSELHARHISAALERTGGNRTAAAELLGITRQTLIAHLKREDGSRQVSLFSTPP